MSDIAVRVEHLSKTYRIAHQTGQLRYRTLRDDLVNAIRAPLQSLRASKAERNQRSELFYALNDVSFDIHQGEVVGIIGRNGAGKSTLLKILSRITEPTSGRAEIYGRIGSLLEVGTGFHPELTGRENIYMSGAVLGMTRAEVQRKFDEIVAFAGVEKFLDTPAKHYSSGMYVRLGFAVAAHLEPEILVVDEVLAVGDAEFQKKCLGKMGEVAHEGRTVLFVSHNMPAVVHLCERTVLLDGGRLVSIGMTHDVINTYMSLGLGTKALKKWKDINKAPGDNIVRLLAVRIENKTGEVEEILDITQPIGITLEYQVLKPGATLVPNIHLFNQDATRVFASLDSDPAWYGKPRTIGHFTSTCWIPGNLLSEGFFAVDVAISSLHPHVTHVYENNAVMFQVTDRLDGKSARGEYAGTMPGVVRPLLNWITKYNTDAQ